MTKKCLCCLTEDLPLQSINSSEKKSFINLTKIEVTLKLSQIKICRSCKKKLRESTEFLNLCLNSYDKFIESIKDETTNKKVKRKLRGKVIEEIETPQDFEESFSQDNSEIGAIVEEIIIENAAQNDPADENVQEEASMNEKTPCNKVKSNKKKTKVWQCDVCGKEFATKFRLVTHFRVHSKEKPYKCDICSLSFAQGNALKCHIRIHTKERPFVCQYCSKSFTQNTTLKTHVAAKHTGKQISCDEPGCEKKFTRRSFFLIHKRDEHTAGSLRNYSCEHCPKQYKHKSHLTRHVEASHLRLRHECKVPGCNAIFTTSWTLKMHKFTHSTEPSQLPYQCKLCELGFQRRDKWLKHLTKVHPNTRFEIPNSLDIPNPPIDENSDNFIVLTTETPEMFTENEIIYEVQAIEMS